MGRFSDVPIPLIDQPFLDYFVPASLRGTGSYDELRARLFGLSLLALWVWAPVFVVVHLVFQHYLLAGISIGCTLAGVLMLGLVRWSGSLALAGNVLSALIWLDVTIFALMLGGLHSPALFWYTIVPLPAYIFGAGRAAKGWLIAAVVGPILFLALDQAHVPLHSSMSVSDGSLMWLLSVEGVVVLVPVLSSMHAGLQAWLTHEAKEREIEKRAVERELLHTQQQVLHRTQEGLRTLVERSPDGVVVYREGRILATNPAFRHMMGEDDEQAYLDAGVDELVSREARADVEDLMKHIADGAAVPYREVTLMGRDDATRVAEVTGLSGVFEGKPAEFLLLRDISARKRLQSREMQLDRMNAVGTLAAGVAHEINNPLAYVHSNTEFLLTQTKKYRHATSEVDAASMLSYGDVTEALEDIREGTSRIRGIVSDLSTFSKSDQNARRPIDVREVLESAMRMADNQLRHRARLATDLADVPAVEANEANLAQVFLNLLVNAAQSIPEGAAEDNEVAVALSHDTSTGRVAIEIRDTGVGIPEEVQARVFDPFFSTKGQDEGMGLGLSICRNIIRDHAGEISFASEPGRGTTFRVELPAVAKRAEVSQEFRSPFIAAGLSGRVLIIDDEPRVCRTLERMLRASYETTTVNSGREALDLLEHDRRFDVIVCDLLMPDVTGVDIYETMTARYPLLAERTVFITGGTFTETTSAFVRRTDRPVVLKPFDITDFREVIDSVGAHPPVVAR